MSNDFWWGLAMLPIAALALAALVSAVCTIALLTWKNDYILGPKRYPDDDASRGWILYAVADMRWVRRIGFFYGWTVIVGRQNLKVQGARVAEGKDVFRAALREYRENGADQ